MKDPISDQQRQELRKLYPMLQMRDEGPSKISGVALASKNIKRLLKAHLPDVKFSVKSDIFANGNSVNVSWTEFEPYDPDGNGRSKLREKIEELIFPFEYGRFDGMTDLSYSDDDPQRQVFRSLFGGAKYIHAQANHLSPAEQAAYDAAKLEKNTQPAASTASRKSKGPGRF